MRRASIFQCALGVAVVYGLMGCAESPQLDRISGDQADTPSTRTATRPAPRPNADSCLASLSVTDVEGPLPETLSKTNCFASLQPFTPQADVAPYHVQSALWTDGADKGRFMSLPATKTISVNPDGSWDLPTGTTLIKQFGLPEKPLETRFMFKTDQIWRFFTYKWRTDGADADLLQARQISPVTISTTEGNKVIEYLYPSREECAYCHSAAAGGELAFVARQLNGQYQYDGHDDNQLRTLHDAGYFDEDPILQAIPVLPDPRDLVQLLEVRVRSYMEANCAHCHQPGANSSGALNLDLRYESNMTDTHLCDPVQFLAPRGAMRIMAGDPDQSWIVLRMERTDHLRMPPFGVSIPDPFGTSLLREWISSMDSCPTSE